MAADSAPVDEFAPEPGSSQLLPTGAITLEVAPLIPWPAELNRRITSLLPAPAGEESGSEASILHLLGYCDPAAGLAGALANGTEGDVATLLSEWHAGCLELLRRWREQPERHRLINLSRLDPAAESKLLRELGIESECAAEAVPPPPPQLPAVVAHYLAQREDVLQLYADLEGCAELLGREPEVPAVPPPLRSLSLAEGLLDEWQANREQADREAFTLRQEIEQQRERENAERKDALRVRNALQTQLNEAHKHIEAARAELQATQAEREQLRCQVKENGRRADQAEQAAQETSARLQDLEEERELVLLQLKQVQDELIHTFQEKTQLQEYGGTQEQRLQEAEERLQALEQECRHLFLHSRLNPEIDRTRIGTILQLVRETLQV